jgi:hypothetical protein
MKRLIILSLLIIIAQVSFSQLQKFTLPSDTKSLIMNGNNISASVYNTGVFSQLASIHNVSDFAWKGLGYAYNVGFVVGAKVQADGSSGAGLLIVDEGFNNTTDGEYGPDGSKWGWLPVAGYANPLSSEFAINTRPVTWPSEWSVWPGMFTAGKNIADVESYYVINDFSNREFPYYPFPADTLKRGLGVQVSVRHFQFDNSTVGDVFFSRYEMENKSPTSLSQVVAGIFLDPHIGGSSDYYDDAAFVSHEGQLAYFWDPDNKSEIPTFKPGYLAIQFEETPMESAVTELGLTSFAAPSFGTIRPKNDAAMWDMLTPGRFGVDGYYPTIGDNVGILGTGYFPLAPTNSSVLAVGMLLADNLAAMIDLADLTSRQYRIYFSAGGKGNPSLALSLQAPVAGQKVQSSTMTITWTSAALDNDTTIDLYYSNTYDQQWKSVRRGIRNTGTYDWDISTMRDGAFYRVYLVNRKNNQAAFDSSAGFFTIDHSGDAPPEIALITPSKNRILSNTCLARWAAGDADGDPVTVVLSTSIDGGDHYTELTSVANNGMFAFDTRMYANTLFFRLKLEARANGKSVFVESPLCTIQNAFPVIRDSVINHVTGYATGKITPLVFNPIMLTGHTYRVAFDSLNGKLVYSVTDQQTKAIKITADTLSTFYGAGQVFDGICLWFSNEVNGPDSSVSGFIPSSVNLRALVAKPSVGIFMPAPFDLKFTFTSLDTTSNGRWISPGDTLPPINGSTLVTCPFRITNNTDNTAIACLVKDLGKIGRWDYGDEIVVLTPAPYKTSAVSVMMGVTFYPPSIPGQNIVVKTGDSFIARNKKAFMIGDVYEFIADSRNVQTGAHSPQQTPVTYELGQNFPNPFNPTTAIRFSLPEAGWVHLQIFDILGRSVETLVDGQLSAGNYHLNWNASQYSSGVYFVRIRIESPDGRARYVETRKAMYMR